ncbi:MAG TPA: 50S ribosomal protein L11 methyltransferase [Bacillota bacterium]
MKWLEVCVHTTNEAIEPVSNILHEKGATGIAIENSLDITIDRESMFGEIFELDHNHFPEKGVYVKAYFPDSNDFQHTLADIKQSVDGLQMFGIDIGDYDIQTAKVYEEDWSSAWKKYYKPVQLTETVTIIPTWEDYTPRSQGECIIKLDPGMAFGTGMHETTKLSVQALEKYVQSDDIVIDVGSGSGILSIASLLFGAKDVYAYDLDEIAVKSTISNAELNRVSEHIHAKQNDLLSGVDLQADIIVANILAEIIVRFVDDARQNLKQGGIFITSGIILAKKQLVLDALVREHFEVLEVQERGDWVSIIAKKIKK